MTNNVAVPQNNSLGLAIDHQVQLPAHLQGMAPVATVDDLVTTVDVLPTISIKGKQFRLKIDGEEKALPPGQPLDAIILAADPVSGLAHAYYEGDYTPGSNDAPDCSSSDGVFPDSFATKPQCSNCAQCPKAAWGSAKSMKGGDAKACRDVKNLLIVNASDPNGTIFKMQVPTMSLKALSAYGRALKKHSLDKLWVTTRISFTDSEFPQLEFSFASFLSADFTKAAVARALSDEVLDLLHEAPTAAPVAIAAPEPVAVPLPTPTVAAPVVETVVETVVADDWGTAPETVAAPAPETVAAPAPETVAAPAPETVAAPSPQGDVDAAGVAWTPTLHATGSDGKGILNTTGLWRARRGVAKAADEIEQVAPDFAGAQAKIDAKVAAQERPPIVDSSASPSAIDDILADWS